MARMSDLGVKPTHFDSHQHVHMIPSIFAILQEIAPRFGYQKCRFVCEPLLRSLPWRRLAVSLRRNNLAKWFIIRLNTMRMRNTFRSPTSYRGLLSSSCLDMDVARGFLRSARQGECIEMGVHIADTSDGEDPSQTNEQVSRFLRMPERKRELDLVTDDSFIQCVRQYGGDLVSYADI